MSSLKSMTRRAWTKLAILGATGVAVLPGCLLAQEKGSGKQSRDASQNRRKLLAKWVQLGRIWRQMTKHLHAERPTQQLEVEFNKLKQEMAQALDALPAWPELRVVFEERWAHIHRLRYVMATCYMMVPEGATPVRYAVEEQVKELENLVAEGKLTIEAARKAAEVLAVQAEYLVQLREIYDPEADAETIDWKAWRKLWEQLKANEIEPREPAQLAGERLAELTVDKLGLLAGSPRANEGLPGSEAPPESGTDE